MTLNDTYRKSAIIIIIDEEQLQVKTVNDLNDRSQSLNRNIFMTDLPSNVRVITSRND